VAEEQNYYLNYCSAVRSITAFPRNPRNRSTIVQTVGKYGGLRHIQLDSPLQFRFDLTLDRHGSDDDIEAAITVTELTWDQGRYMYTLNEMKREVEQWLRYLPRGWKTQVHLPVNLSNNTLDWSLLQFKYFFSDLNLSPLDYDAVNAILDTIAPKRLHTVIVDATGLLQDQARFEPTLCRMHEMGVSTLSLYIGLEGLLGNQHPLLRASSLVEICRFETVVLYIGTFFNNPTLASQLLENTRLDELFSLASEQRPLAVIATCPRRVKLIVTARRGEGVRHILDAKVRERLTQFVPRVAEWMALIGGPHAEYTTEYREPTDEVG
jgi:hypothetical protein